MPWIPVASICLLSDVLPHLTILSLVFQRKDVDLSIVQPQQQLHLYFSSVNNPGPNLKQLDDTLSKLSSEFGLKVTEEISMWKLEESTLASSLTILNIGLKTMTLLFWWHSLTPLMQLKSSHGSSFDTYGSAELETIAARCPTPVISERLEHEWIGFRTLLVTEFSALSASEVMITTSKTLSSCTQLFQTS